MWVSLVLSHRDQVHNGQQRPVRPEAMRSCDITRSSLEQEQVGPRGGQRGPGGSGAGTSGTEDDNRLYGVSSVGLWGCSPLRTRRFSFHSQCEWRGPEQPESPGTEHVKVHPGCWGTRGQVLTNRGRTRSHLSDSQGQGPQLLGVRSKVGLYIPVLLLPHTDLLLTHSFLTCLYP